MQGKVENVVAEISKYKKKRDSSISKSYIKTKHKHMYKDCLFVDKKERCQKGMYCIICGKVGEISLGIERITGNSYIRLTDKEIYEKYKHLELVEIERIIPKYLPIRKKEGAGNNAKSYFCNRCKRYGKNRIH